MKSNQLFHQAQVSTSPVSNHFYYPSLDGLRFFAFLIVFLHHSLQNISSDNFFLNYILIIIQKNGWVGVDLFFVLSGFLITTLLLKERDKYGKFSLKNFWIRRALRIWPLYYLALIVGFFVVPILFPANNAQNLSSVLKELPLYLIFLGNWQVSLNGYSSFSNISHLWTISLEEQFYFIWPLILIIITSFKRSILIALIIIISACLARLQMSHFGVIHPGIYTNTFARIDTLTLGGLLALIIHYKPNFLNFKKTLSKPIIFISVLILFSLFLYKGFLFDPTRVWWVVFGYLIIALIMTYFVFISINEKSKLSLLLSFQPFVWLGKISYGLYIWHIVALEISGFLIYPIFGFGISWMISLILTILLGALSYYGYEKFFLQHKNKFSTIISRPVQTQL